MQRWFLVTHADCTWIDGAVIVATGTVGKATCVRQGEMLDVDVVVLYRREWKLFPDKTAKRRKTNDECDGPFRVVLADDIRVINMLLRARLTLVHN